MSLQEEVEAAFEAEPASGRDRGAATLALTYARRIDGDDRCCECGGPMAGADLAKLGPALLAVLESLLMSPRARAAAKKAVTDDKPVANPLDQLAEARARKGRAEAVDAAAP